MGEWRPPWRRPGRGAVVGLLACALGIRRDEAERQTALDRALHYAVRTDSGDDRLVDLQSVEAGHAPGHGKMPYHTRGEELAADRTHTVLSRREYRTDTCFTAVVWRRNRESGDDDADLHGLRDALRRPAFTPYPGRRCAPLGLPIDARVVDAESFIAALRADRPREIVEQVLRTTGTSTRTREVAADTDAPGAPDGARIEERADVPLSRTRWTFGSRSEAVFRMAA